MPNEVLLKALPVGGNRMDDRLAIEEASKQFGKRPLILDGQEEPLTPRDRVCDDQMIKLLNHLPRDLRDGDLDRGHLCLEHLVKGSLSDKATADLFEAAAQIGHPPTLGKQFISFWSAKANARGCTIAGLGIDAGRLGELAKITADGVINATAAAAIADKMLDCPDWPSAIAQAEGLVQVRDEGQMQAWVDEAFAANEKAVQDALGSPKKQQQARGFLTGQVMQISKGKADPKIVGELIARKLSSMGGQ